MIKKILFATSLSVVSFCSMGSISSMLFDVPLAKKCYAIHKELLIIGDAQTTEICKAKLNVAKSQTENAALRIAEDDNYSAKSSLDQAIYVLRHAQVYECSQEEKILAAELKLADIKASLKK